MEEENQAIMDGNGEESYINYEPTSRLGQAAQRLAFTNYSTAGKDEVREGKGAATGSSGAGETTAIQKRFLS